MLVCNNKVNYKQSFGTIHYTNEARQLLKSRLLSGKQIEKLRKLRDIHKEIGVDLYFDRAYDEVYTMKSIGANATPQKVYKNYLTCRMGSGKNAVYFAESLWGKLLTGPIGFVKMMAKNAEKAEKAVSQIFNDF